MPKKATVVGLESNGAPYSPVVKIGNHYYFSGVIPNVVGIEKKPESPDNIEEQTRQVLAKIRNLLAKCGLTANDIYGVTLLLAGSTKNLSKVNEIYLELWPDHGHDILPRRKAFAVEELPFGVMIEIEFEAINQKEWEKHPAGDQ